jgi:hypothetical protein
LLLFHQYYIEAKIIIFEHSGNFPIFLYNIIMKKINYFLFTASYLILNSIVFSQQGVWQTIQSSPSVSLQDCYFLNNGLNGWCVGSTGSGSQYVSAVCVTTNGGTNWTSVPNLVNSGIT